jgi:gliding motility-associated-like protein
LFSQGKTKRNCEIEAPKSVCTSYDLSDSSVTLSWGEIINLQSNYSKTEIHSIEHGIIKITTDINERTLNVNKTFFYDHFFLLIHTTCSNTYYSTDTIQTLTFSLTNPSDGTAILRWNEKQSTSNYLIEKSNVNQPWERLATTKAIEYIDTITECAPTSISYRIVLNEQGCSSKTPVLKDVFKDLIAPYPPQFSSITYDTIHPGLFIRWKKPRSRDIAGVILYKIENNQASTLSVTQLPEKNEINLLYTNPENPISYSIAAFDFCPSSAPPAPQTSAKQTQLHKPMFLQNRYNICAKEIKLSWTNYVGWEEIASYRIFTKIDTENKWKLIDSTLNQFYTFKIERNKNYQFVIEAKSTKNESAFSNIIFQFTNTPKSPSFNHLNYVSIENNLVKISHKIESNYATNIHLEKKNEKGKYIVISKKNIIGDEVIFYDSLADPNYNNFTYRTQAFDSCLQPFSYSDEVSTIQLKIIANEMEVNNLFTPTNCLTWNNYTGKANNVIYYEIYKNGGLSPVAKVTSNQLYYYDYIYFLSDTQNTNCYTIQAIENNSSTKSTSNTVCITTPPKCFIPNTFVPSGFNKVFKPEINLYQINSYRLSIMDRWGQLIYESREYNEGWNGRNGGFDAPTGAYMYIVQFKDSNEKEYTYRGFITLLR